MARLRTIATVRPQNTVHKSGNHPTRDRLLRAAVELTAEHLPQSITSEMVLEKAQVSRGSLYHHFSDLSELLELAMIQGFAVGVDESIAGLTKVLSTSKNKDEFIKRLFTVTKNTQLRSLKKLRFQRARLIAFTEDNPRLANLLASEQQRLTDAMTALFSKAQEKGWFGNSFDPRSAAVLVQAYSLGKLIDDIVPNPMSEDGWNNLINQVVSRVFAA